MTTTQHEHGQHDQQHRARRSPSSRLPDLIRAILGPAGWRLWWPLLLLVVSAIVARVWLALLPSDLDRAARGDLPDMLAWAPSTQLPGSLTVYAAALLAPALLWAWGARAAVHLGHPRRAVALVTAGLVLLVSLGSLLVVVLAQGLELQLVGSDGPLVFLVDSITKARTDGFLFLDSMALVYGAMVLPWAAGTSSLATVLSMRHGLLRGAPLGVLIGLVGLVLWGVVMAILPDGLGTSGTMMTALAWAVTASLLTLAVQRFRSTPV